LPSMDTNDVHGGGKPGKTGEAGTAARDFAEATPRRKINRGPVRRATYYRASKGLVRALVAQAVMLGIAVLVCGLLAGWAGAASALIGGGAYLVPNALFALRLLAGLWGPVKTSPYTFFMGEAFKLASTMVVLGLVGWQGSGWIVWPAVVAGLLCVLKGYVLLLIFRKLP